MSSIPTLLLILIIGIAIVMVLIIFIWIDLKKILLKGVNTNAQMLCLWKRIKEWR